MTIAKHFPVYINDTTVTTDAEIAQATTPRTYNRILVLLDNYEGAQQAVRVGASLARQHNASMVLVGENQPGSKAYIDRTCRQFEEEDMPVHGYTVSSAIADLPDWLLNSEQADAIVIAQKPTGWLGRLLGHDMVANLRARTTADVIQVGCCAE